jgi:hypothetical protein
MVNTRSGVSAQGAQKKFILVVLLLRLLYHELTFLESGKKVTLTACVRTYLDRSRRLPSKAPTWFVYWLMGKGRGGAPDGWGTQFCTTSRYLNGLLKFNKFKDPNFVRCKAASLNKQIPTFRWIVMLPTCVKQCHGSLMLSTCKLLGQVFRKCHLDFSHIN